MWVSTRYRQVMKEFSTCPHFLKCSGCTIDRSKMAPDTRHIKDFFQSFDWVVGEIFSWRMRAKLAIRKTGMGLFRKNSHEVIEIPLCQTHHPSINQAAELLKKNRFDPYDEETGSGTFRYAQFCVCRESNKVQLTLVIQKDLEEREDRENSEEPGTPEKPE